MKKISFSWKPTISGREKWRLGLFMIVPSRSGRSQRLRIMVRGVLLWMLGLAVASYFALTTAWFFVLQQRTTNYVTWMDCILAPARWDEIERKRGDAYVAEGLNALEERKWSEAILKIRAGLARSPDNWKGRRSLGIFFLAAGQREQGINLLVEGFQNRYPGREAVELAFTRALAGESYEKALELVDSCLAQSGTAIDRDREWLQDQKCRILMIAERYEDALAWISQLTRMSEVRFESEVVALIELGRFSEARTALDTWAQGSGVLGGSRRLAVRLAREEGDVVAMREALGEMQKSAPLEPQPRVYALIQEYLIGQEDAAQEALSSYLMRFDSAAKDYELVAEPLSQIEAWELYDRLMQHAAERGIESKKLRRIRISALTARGEYDIAKTAINELRQGTFAADPRDALWLNVMEYWVSQLSDGDDASRDQLKELLNSPAIALPTLKQVATSLEAVDRELAALSIWEITNRRFPGIFTAEQNVKRLRQVLGARAEEEMEIPLVQDGVELDLDAVLPKAEKLDPEIAVALQSTRRFERLATGLMAEQKWAELSELMRELRRANPVWMSSQSDLISRAEIELNIVERNWPALISILRFQLDGSVENALVVMKLVRRLDDLGERRAAEIVLTEVERRHPNFPPVQRMRAEWAPEDEKIEAVPESGSAGDEAEEALLPVRT